MHVIKIKNWSSFQSYKDRRPPWIRFSRNILDDYEYQSMSADSRALLPMLWLLASEYEDPSAGVIELHLKKISFRLRIEEELIKKCVTEIEQSGFILRYQNVTDALQNRNETVTPETEAETDSETESDSVSVAPQEKKSLDNPHKNSLPLSCNQQEGETNAPTESERGSKTGGSPAGDKKAIRLAAALKQTGTAIPEYFARHAASKGWSEYRIRGEWSDFYEYYVTNVDDAKNPSAKSWEAKCRKWISNDIGRRKYANAGGGANAAQNEGEHASAWIAASLKRGGGAQ